MDVAPVKYWLSLLGRFELSGPDGTVAYPTSPRAIAHPKLFNNETYGEGPYVLDPSQTVTGDHYTFVPNKFYYDPTQIRFKKVIVKVIASKASILQALETHEIDIADGDVTTASAAMKPPSALRTRPTPSPP